MEKKVYGKINLSLHILGKRPDGYHELDTLMQTVDVADTLVVERAPRLSLETDAPNVPTDESNLCVRAWMWLRERFAIPPVRMQLTKRIPVAAGMGGGSADAAAALTAMIEMFELALSPSEWRSLAPALGADVPYFRVGGTCRATGIGEVLTPLPSYAGKPLLLINDGAPVSTAEVYRKGPRSSSSRIPELLPRLEAGETKLPEAHNDLMPVAEALHPPLARIRRDLIEAGADTALLSGAGGTVYGLFADEKARDRAYEALRDAYAWVTRTVTK